MVMRASWRGDSAELSRERIDRALNVSTAGSVLVQQNINRIVQELHVRHLGVSSTLERDPGSGPAAYVNRRTPGADAEWVDDTDSYTERTGTVAQGTYTYKTLGTNGRVTRKVRVTGRSYGDTLMREINSRVGDFNATFEAGLVRGSVAASSKQIDGLITVAQATASQVIVPSGATSAGFNLTLDLMDEAIDAVKDSAQSDRMVIFANKLGRRKLNALLQAQQQSNDKTEIDAGFRVRTYDDIPIVTTTGITSDSTFDGSTITAFTGESSNPTTCIIVVHLDYVRIEELTELTIMPLAQGTSQYNEFDIFWDGVLVPHNTLGLSIIPGIKIS